MRRYRKWFVIFGILIWAGISGVMIYHINRIFPNPENKAICTGETDLYKGFTLKAGEIEIYTWEELLQVYPDWQDDSVMKEDPETAALFNYVIVNCELTNNTKDKLENNGKEGIMNWVIEAEEESNGVDYMSMLWLNKDYHNSYEAGETQSLKIPYMIRGEYIPIEELRNMDIKMVYSYYPTKNYILYKAGKKEKS